MNKFIVANWKMNGSTVFIEAFFQAVATSVRESTNQIIICPPFPYLIPLSQALINTPILLGAQNCHTAPQGAFTGEVSAAMLSNIGCHAVIVGHSERRTLFGESNEVVKAKATSVHEAGMTAIVCIGETLTVRESGQAIDRVIKQLEESLPSSATSHNTLIAYEPVWAIGTGLTPSVQEITQMHQAIHAAQPLPLLYGGSVTEHNAPEILALPYVDGVLVGGASLKADSFLKIIGA